MTQDTENTANNMEVAELETQRLPLSSVSPHEANPRTHSDRQIKELQASLTEHGYAAGSMTVQRSTMRLVKGHGIYEALQGLGCVEADFVIADMTDAEALLFLARDNRLSDLSAFDVPKLKAITVGLQKIDVPLERIGFDEGEFKSLESDWAKSERDNRVIEEDDPPEVSEDEPITQTGDLWHLGAHRVLCGDSTKAEDVERVMGGEKADMGLASPPYAVGKEYEVGVSFEQHLELLQGVADRSLEAIKPGGFFVVNFGEIGSQKYASELTGSERQCLYPISKDYWQIFHTEHKMDLYAQRIWYKPFNRLQQPFWTYKTSIPHYQEWEHIWTWRLPGGEGDQVHDWDISSRAIWDTRDESTDDKPLTRHVAAFPVCLPGRALKAHSEAGHIVWEPFLGSGTTLIAADQLDRKCVGLEISEKYCDVIVQRYINHKGASEDVWVERGTDRITWEQITRSVKVV